MDNKNSKVIVHWIVSNVDLKWLLLLLLSGEVDIESEQVPTPYENRR